jgi:hypothetical protein
VDETGSSKQASLDAKAIADAITTGELDDSLHPLGRAINERHAELAARRRAGVLARPQVGGRVTIGPTAQPKYLRGRSGEVHEIEGDMATVCLDAPVGRFTDGHLRCPAELLVPNET